MTRRVARLTLDTLADLPDHVRSSLFWELDPVEAARRRTFEEACSEKEAWLSAVLLDWGSCGRVVYVDDEPAGYIQYAPGRYFPGSVAFPTAPISDDAVQLATVEVFDDHVGGGLGRCLMQAMVKDLVWRGGIRAVECFGVAGTARRSGSSGRPGEPRSGVLPVEFLLQVGFKTQRPHLRTPRMRMDLWSVLTWREQVEGVLERLLGVVRPVRPAPAPSPLGNSREVDPLG